MAKTAVPPVEMTDLLVVTPVNHCKRRVEAYIALRYNRFMAKEITSAEYQALAELRYRIRKFVREGDAVARAAGAVERLWLCHPRREFLAGLRHEAGDAHLVHSTRLRRMPHGPERLAAHLANDGIDVVNLHRTDWTGGLTTLFHRFGRLTFGWDAQHERMILELVDIGIDGVYSDHVDRMMEALRARAG